MNAHEQIQFKITAFLFNRRADALREEMYQALCLTVFKEINDPLTYDQIVERMILELGIPSGVTESFRTIIIDEINQLVKDKRVVKEGDCFSLPKDIPSNNALNNGQAHLLEVIRSEIGKIAVNIIPSISETEISKLIEFYIDVTDVVAKHQVNFAPKGFRLQEISTADDNIRALVKECADKFKVAEIIDIDKFIQRSLIRPTEPLADYIYKLIQVSIISQLLTWDPSLEYLHNRLMASKVLYLDSSILFCLMQSTDPLHHFVKSMLLASKKDLGVVLKVHTSTIEEYQGVLDAYNSRFSNESRYLRDIAKSCKENGEDPAEYLDSSIFVDYISRSVNHVDLGTWQRYYASMSGKPLEESLKNMGITICRENARVPDDDFWRIKDAMARASATQLERGKRKYEKTNLDHDARMYYLVSKTRKKSGDDLSLSYDTFLLTMDGSLPYFLKEYGLSWTETYFMFPSQWYQLTFPFLRISANQSHQVSLGMTFMAFSTAFPSLAKLVPLELCEYVFEEGGTKLSMGAVSAVVGRLYEERLITSLDPSNKDIQKKEAARLRVQRIIAEEEMTHRKSILTLEQEKQSLEQERFKLGTDISELERDKQNLEEQRNRLSQEVEELDKSKKELATTEIQVPALQNVDHDATPENDSSQVQVISDLQQELKEQREQYRIEIDNLRNEILADRSQREEEKAETARKKDQNRQTAKNIVVTAFMLVGLLVALSILISALMNIYIILGATALMSIGTVLYSRIHRSWISFTIYLLGGTVVVVSLLDKTQTLLATSFIPIVMDVTAKILEIYLDKKL